MEEGSYWNVMMVTTRMEMDARLTVNCSKVMFAQEEVQYQLIPAKK
jgi:hypothetical protein